MRINPISSLRGQVLLPGDKSISHRYAILGALAEGKTRISGFSSSQDCRATLNCLRALGVGALQRGEQVEVESPGWRKLVRPATVLEAQNSGTTIRLLTALLAASPFISTIQGDESLNKRPMKRIIVPLTRMGAEIEAQGEEFPPLTIKGTHLQGIRYCLPVASAQVKSCVLLAGLMAGGKTTVVEPFPSRDHTERALPCFGVALQKTDHELTVEGETSVRPASVTVPGDFSAAVYFILAALLVPNSRITLHQVGVNPSRTAVLTLLEQAGVALERSAPREINGEPVCDLTVSCSSDALHRFPARIGPEWIPGLIDEIPALAVLGTRLKNGLTVRGAQELRTKESDRIQTIVLNLRNLGVEVEEFADGFFIPPAPTLRGGMVRTCGDHRIAMAFAVAGLMAREGVEIDDPDCAAVSFPHFFDQLKAVCI